MVATIGGLFRRSDSQSTRRERGVPGARLAVVAFVCLGVGYVAGNAIPYRAANADGLHAEAPAAGGPANATGNSKRNGTQPTVLGDDTKALHPQALVTAGYYDRDVALAAVRSLQEQGIGKARLREMGKDKSGTQWAVVVYYGDDKEHDAFVQQLRAARAPDLTFEETRKTFRDSSGKDWPPEMAIR